MEGDELELEKIGDRKTALFCIVSDTNMTFNFISAMVYTQMFNVLCDKALENGGALKTHVTCLLDEFANQKIPNFQHLISVIRSREISAHIVVQTQSQLTLKANIAEMEKALEKVRDTKADIDRFAALIRKYTSFEKLDRFMLHELIDRITIYETPGMGRCRKGKEKRITIYYKFVGAIQ